MTLAQGSSLFPSTLQPPPSTQTTNPTTTMAKPKTPPAPVLTLAEIEGLTATQAADQVGEKYKARTRIFVEMGKLVYHLEHRAKLTRGQTIYGILQARGVPEGSVHNARMAATFIKTFVETGLLTESRADEIITHRTVNRISQIVSGKTACALSAAELAALMKDADKAAIGDELDCLAEHGLTIAAKAEKDKADAEEAKRLADLAARAAELEAQQAAEKAKADADAAAAAATTVVGSDAPGRLEATPAADTPRSPEGEVGSGTPAAEIDDEQADFEAGHPGVPAAEDDTPPTIVDGTREFGNGAGTGRTATKDVAPVIAAIEAAELQSYDLDESGLAAVRAKIAAWLATIDSTLAAPKSDTREVALAS